MLLDLLHLMKYFLDMYKILKCRIRDLTYSAPIYVDVEYMMGPEVFFMKV